MSHKFRIAANISWMFKESKAFESRYQAAKNAGFEGVECACDPYSIPLQTVADAKKIAGVEQVLINGCAGNQAGNPPGKGIAALPDKVEEFKKELAQSVEYAKALNCPRIHIMAGCVSDKYKESEMEATYIKNLKYAGEILHKENMTALIEPINSKISIPNYFLDDPDKAVKFINEVNLPNVKLQLDMFHMQIIGGNLTGNIVKYLPYIGHMQIAQVPCRNEPDTAGEINYPYIFSVLEKNGYSGWIGLEYNPAGDTNSGLKWLKSMGFAN